MYNCTADILFILFAFSFFAYDELKQFYLFGHIHSMTYIWTTFWSI